MDRDLMSHSIDDYGFYPNLHYEGAGGTNIFGKHFIWIFYAIGVLLDNE